MSTSAEASPNTAVAARPRRARGALAGLRARIARLRLVHGAISLAVGVLLAVLLSFVLDYCLSLPVAVRALFLVGGALAFAIAVYRRLVSPLSSRTSEGDLARLVDAAHPELRQSLVTAIQLSREDSEAARHVSPSLLGSVVADVEKHVGNIAFDRVLRLGSLVRRAALLAGLAAAIVVGVTLFSNLSSIWFQRNVLLGKARWPKGTVLAEPVLPQTVAVGDDLLLEVRLLKGSPKMGRVLRELDDGEEREYVMDLREAASWDVELRSLADTNRARAVLTALGRLDESAAQALGDGEGVLARGISAGDAEELETALADIGAVVETRSFDVFVHEFRNVSNTLRFDVEAGDDRIGPYEVEVRTRPRIDMSSIQLSYELPEYTGEAGVREQNHGNLKVPSGTRVRYSMATTIPVARAFFVFREGRRSRDETADAWPDAGAIDLAVGPDSEDASRTRFEGSFVVGASGRYYFQFEDTRGFQSRRSELFRIQAVLDRKPSVEITLPERLNEQVTPSATVTIRVRIEDDYRIRRAVLEGVYFPPSGEGRVEQSIELPGFTTPDGATLAAADAPRETEVEIALPVTSIQAGTDARPLPGGRFEFFALAEDFGTSGEVRDSGEAIGNIGESQVHRLDIVDAEALKRSLSDQLLLVRDQLRQLHARQEAVRKNLQQFREEAAVAGQIAKKQASQLSRHRQDQAKIADGLSSQTSELDRLLRKMNANAVDDERMKAWVSDVREDVAAIAEKRAPALAESIDDLRRAANETPQEPGSVDDIVAAQRRVERELRSLVLRLEEFGDKNALIELLRDAKRRQERIRDTTRSLVPDAGKDT